MKSAEEIRKMTINRSSPKNVVKKYLEDIEDEIKTAANLSQHKIIYKIDYRDFDILQSITSELIRLGYKVKTKEISDFRDGDYIEIRIAW